MAELAVELPQRARRADGLQLAIELDRCAFTLAARANAGVTDATHATLSVAANASKSAAVFAIGPLNAAQFDYTAAGLPADEFYADSFVTEKDKAQATVVAAAA